MAVLALALVAALAALPFSVTTPTQAGGRAVLRQEVTQTVALKGTARVLISLRTPGAQAGDIAVLRSQTAAAQDAVLASVPPGHLQVTYRYTAIPAIAGTVDAEALDALAASDAVAVVEPDGIGKAATNQSGPLIHATEAQAAGLTGAGVTIAVLDSGIDTDHPDLAGDIAYERCFLTSGPCGAEPHPAEDDNGHGTNVSGVITSDGTVAPKGIAPGAKIAAYKILNAAGAGFFSDWVAAIDDILSNHPEVKFVNMSLQSSSHCALETLAGGIVALRQVGVLTFIAAGNHGTKNSFTIPACMSEGISVGAVYDASIGTVNGWKTTCSDVTTAADQVACWSDSSDELDLLAPGAAITSTGRGGATSTYYGTSQATPHAAAVAALLVEAKPSLTPDQIEAQLEQTGTLTIDDLDDADPDTNRTTPRIDARVALLGDDDDTDGDGCSNSEELGDDEELGGLRDPLDPWDFFDTNGDKIVSLIDDVFEVAFAFGSTSGQAGYSTILDRSAPAPGTPFWRMGAPDGTVDLLTDVFGVALQFGHSCAAGP